MRPAYKFLKHTPRGLKEIKGKALVEEIAKVQEALARVEDGAKRLVPLKFKSRT
jgi:hypothetical protein